MGFTKNVGGSDRMSDMEAELANIGIDYQKYKDGKEEHRIIVVWNPINDSVDRRIQTDIISTSTLLKIAGRSQTIRVGSSENFFELELGGDIIEEGELGYKAAAWMDGLEKLKVPLPEKTGDLTELVGLQAVIHQTTFNEALGRKAKDKEKPFWMPTKIISMPAKKVPLKERIVDFISTEKTENEVIAWSKENDVTMKEVFANLDAEMKDGRVVFDGKTYMRKQKNES